MIDTEFLREVFQQHGLVGFVVGFLILGPGFTFIRTRNMKVQVETRAQELVNEFAMQYHEQAQRLEKRLNKALARLSKAKDEVALLKLSLLEAQQELESMPHLQSQVETLTKRVGELENLLERERQENAQLLQEMKQIASPSPIPLPSQE